MEDRKLIDLLRHHTATIWQFMEFEVTVASDADLAELLGGAWFDDSEWNEPGYRFSPVGQDGCGGQFAVWIRPEAPAPHPVVFFGSEGEHGVLTASLEAWVQAIAYGPGLSYRTEPVSLKVDENWKLEERPPAHEALAGYRRAVEAELGPVPGLDALTSDIDALNAEFCAWVAKVSERREAAAAAAHQEAVAKKKKHDDAVQAALAAGLECPRCGGAELRYLSGLSGPAAVGCKSCGRSFDPLA